LIQADLKVGLYIAVAKKTTRSTKKSGRPGTKRGDRVIAKAEPASPKRRGRVIAKAGHVVVSEVAELEELRRELERAAGGAPARWNADPDEVQRSVAQLVLTLVEFVRKLLERQAIRRMESGTLTEEQTEEVGRALMKLEETVREIADKFGVPIEDLNLDLGPVGKLL
jgi:hypothetical protein